MFFFSRRYEMVNVGNGMVYFGYKIVKVRNDFLPSGIVLIEYMYEITNRLNKP